MRNVLARVVRALPMAALGLSVAIGFSAALPDEARAAHDKTEKCGGIGEKPCPIGQKATYISKGGKCPKGSFFDPRNGGECWSCPSGTHRTIFPVTGKDACEQRIKTEYAKADKKRKVKIGKKGCHKGEFWDKKGGGLGACWECPKGYKRGLVAVDKPKACVKITQLKHFKATKEAKFQLCEKGFFDPRKGGECWKCPGGYFRGVTPVNKANACIVKPADVCDAGNILVYSKCQKKGQCGKQGQRPCLVVERIPSCDKGLLEDPIDQKCVKPADLACTLLTGIMNGLKATAAGAAKAKKAEKKVEDFIGEQLGKAVKTILPKPVYKEMTKAVTGVEKKLKKEAKQFEKLLEPAAKEMSKRFDTHFIEYAEAVAHKEHQLFKLLGQKSFCFLPPQQKIAKIRDTLGITPVVKYAGLPPSMEREIRHAWYENLFIKQANAVAKKRYYSIGVSAAGAFSNPMLKKAGLLGKTAKASAKKAAAKAAAKKAANAKEGKVLNIDATLAAGPTVGVYIVTDFDKEVGVRVGVGGVLSSQDGLDFTLDLAEWEASHISDISGWGFEVSISFDMLSNLGSIKNPRYRGLAQDTTMFFAGTAKPYLIGAGMSFGYKHDEGSATVVGIEFGGGYDFSLTKN